MSNFKQTDFKHIPLFKVNMESDIALKHLKEVFESGYIGEGDKVKEFEEAFRELVKAPSNIETLMVNSCTSALVLAIEMLNLKGKKVAVNDLTCSATIHAILQAGAIPILLSNNEDDFNLDLQNFPSEASAVVSVNWGPYSLDAKKIKDAAGWDIPVIHDAAHSLFVDWDKAGDFVCWSFQAIKFLTTGDGGAISVKKSQSDLLKKLRWFGLSRNQPTLEQEIKTKGFKFQPNNIMASIGLANIDKAEKAASVSKDNANYLTNAILKIIDEGRYITSENRDIGLTYKVKDFSVNIYIEVHDEDGRAFKLVSIPYNIDLQSWVYPIKVLSGLYTLLKEWFNVINVETSMIHSHNMLHSYFYANSDRTYLKYNLNNDILNSYINLPVSFWLTKEDLDLIALHFCNFLSNIPVCDRKSYEFSSNFDKILKKTLEKEKETYAKYTNQSDKE